MMYNYAGEIIEQLDMFELSVDGGNISFDGEREKSRTRNNTYNR